MPRLDQSRWQRPLNVARGHWKKQLPGKYLKLGSARDSTKLRALIQQHPEHLNHQGNHGRTFLFEAIRKGRHETVEWLLAQGSNPNLTGCYNSETFVQLNALAAATHYNQHHLLDLLKSHGATHDVWRATFCGDLELLDSFLTSEPSVVHREDPNDEIYYYPPISFAIAGGHGDVAQYLASRGAEIEKYGVQLLFIAAHQSRLDLVQWLTSKGASASSSDSSMWVSTNDIEIIEHLTHHGLGPNQKRYSGLSPLQYVCRADKAKSADKVRLLLSLGANVNEDGPQGRTALHYAAVGGDLEIIRLLLDAGADQHATTNKNETPKAIASKHKQQEAAARL